MRRFGGILLVAVGLLFVAVSMVRADIAMPRDKWSDIRMVSEHVKIVLSPTDITVEGTYFLENQKEALTAVVGYPRGVMEKSLEDFTVTVDGEVVTVSSQAGSKDERVPRMGPAPSKTGEAVKSAYQFDGPYPECKTFSVKFDAKQQRKVVVKYHVAPAEVKSVDKGSLLAFIYTLKTGATWRGKIDSAVIEASLKGLSMQDIVTVTPKTVSKTDAATAPLMWVFKDFKPTQDIEITFRAPK